MFVNSFLVIPIVAWWIIGAISITGFATIITLAWLGYEIELDIDNGKIHIHVHKRDVRYMVRKKQDSVKVGIFERGRHTQNIEYKSSKGVSDDIKEGVKYKLPNY